jgi:hypothetical protein
MENAAYVIEAARSGRSVCKGGASCARTRRQRPSGLARARLRQLRAAAQRGARSAAIGRAVVARWCPRVAAASCPRARRRASPPLTHAPRLLLPPACKETIGNGQTRLGSIKVGGIGFGGGNAVFWRCAPCITAKVASNVAAKYGGGVELVPVRRRRRSRGASRCWPCQQTG